MPIRRIIHPQAFFPRSAARCRTLRGLLAVIVCCAIRGQAQYRFDHWTADNGLPQNSVRDIVQTRDGYLWLTTFDGLVRFDGVRFTVFNKSNSPGIANNRFVQLFEDRHGDLWAALETGGLVRRHQGRFTTYTKGQGLAEDLVTSLGDDGQGNLLLLHVERAFRWSDGKFQPVTEPRPPASGAPAARPDHVQHLAMSILERGLAAPGAACFVDGQLRVWAKAEFPVDRLVSTRYPMQDARGDTWFVTSDNLLRTTQGRLAQVYSRRTGLPGQNPALVFGKRPLQTVSRDEAGRLWLTELDSLRSELMAMQTPEGMEDIRVCYADREGNTWIGTFNHGLFRARKQTVTAYSAAQGLRATEVYPLLEGRDGAFWIGATGSDGLIRYKDGVFTSYGIGPHGWGESISALYEDRAGRLWINGKGHLVEGRYVRVLGQDMVPDALNFVWTMAEDRAGAYWIGTVHGVVCVQNGAATIYTTKDGLAGNDTKVILDDGAGGLWLGSYGGLTHYRDGKFTAWTEKDGMPGNTVRALKQDGDGTLWIGTYDSGLGRFKDGRFTRYTMRDGLFDNGVFQILEDDAGWCWMSCNRGIYRVRKQELNDFADGRLARLTSIAYGKSDGMPSAECNGGRWPAGVRASDGKLWFPTMGGVAVIDPATIRTNSQPPPVVIEGMRIDNQSVGVELMDSAIQIRPEQQNFEIEYTALSFINSETLRFKYKLEGWDQDWVEAGTRRTAYFSHVAPGDYTFRVIAANRDGVWNMEGQSLRIRVLPPFYRTWWFLGLAALLVGGVIVAAFKYRVAQLEARQAAQQAFARQLIESQEGERKRIAGELHDSLGQNLLVIKNRALYGLLEPNDAPRAAAQLSEISTGVSQTLDEVRQIAANLHPYQLDRLGLTKALKAMAQRVAEAAHLDIVTACDNIDGLFAPATEINLYRIVQESLNNIVKHAAATEASVRIERDGPRVTVTVHDNGRGFTSNAPGDGKGGFGLTGMTERAHLLGGALDIDSAPGEGTTVTLRIELPKDKLIGKNNPP
jgi:signal transduction histidine kinase/ligand-binding sensor domain-containing protein